MLAKEVASDGQVWSSCSDGGVEAVDVATPKRVQADATVWNSSLAGLGVQQSKKA